MLEYKLDKLITSILINDQELSFKYSRFIIDSLETLIPKNPCHREPLYLNLSR
jgi:hypothetical protein